MISRRTFLKMSGLATAGLVFTGMNVANAMKAKSRDRVAGANRKVNLACIGTGNRGAEIFNEFDKTGFANIIALCDVDLGATHTQAILNKFPDAKRFKDFREMFDKMGNEIDAVCAGIPDFAHFPVAMLSMSLGKHIYMEKPIARTFYESELMIRAAGKYRNVVTQAGTQGHSEANYFQFKAWKDAGIIKDVTAVTAHMNSRRCRHSYDPGIYKFPDAQPIPSSLNWDLWLTTAMYHDYQGKRILIILCAI